MARVIMLDRLLMTSTFTLGKMVVTGDHGIELFECISLELPWRGNQPRTSCVPEGRYPMKLEWSPSFRANLWELKDVPGRDEVKIHAANYVTQLRGCIAPGLKAVDINGDGTLDISSSRVAFVRLMAAIGATRKAEIIIRNLDTPWRN